MFHLRQFWRLYKVLVESYDICRKVEFHRSLGAGKKIAFSNGHISTYIDNYFPLKYAQEESCMAVKNLLKVFENSRHFLSYDHFCFSHMGAVGRR